MPSHGWRIGLSKVTSRVSSSGKSLTRPQGHPVDRRLPRPEEVADEGDAHRGRGDGAEPVSQPAEERAPLQSGVERGSEGGGLETGSIVVSLS